MDAVSKISAGCSILRPIDLRLRELAQLALLGKIGMYNLIPHFILIAGLGGVLIIIGRKIPALSALQVEEKPLISPRVKAFLSGSYCRCKERLNTDKIQIILLARLEKFLRRFQIVTLKVDNGISSWLKKIREKTIAATPVVYWSVFKKEEQAGDDEAANGAPREAEDI